MKKLSKATICKIGAALLAIPIVLGIIYLAVPANVFAGNNKAIVAADAVMDLNGVIRPANAKGGNHEISVSGVPNDVPISLDSPKIKVTGFDGELNGNLYASDSKGNTETVDYLLLNSKEDKLVAYCGSDAVDELSLMLVTKNEKNISAKLTISPVRETIKAGNIESAAVVSTEPYSYNVYGSKGEKLSLKEITGLDDFLYGAAPDSNGVIKNPVPCSEVVLTETGSGYALLPVDANGNAVSGQNIYMAYDTVYAFDITINSSVVEHSEDNGDAFFWSGDHYWIPGDLLSNGKHNDRYVLNGDNSKVIKEMNAVKPYTKTVTGHIGDSFIASDLDEVIIYAAVGDKRNWNNAWINLSQHASDAPEGQGYRTLNAEINHFISLNSYYDKINFFRISDDGKGGAKLTYVLPNDTARYDSDHNRTFFTWENYQPRTGIEFDVNDVDLYTTRPSLLRETYSSEPSKGKSDHIQGRIPTNIMVNVNGNTYSGNLKVLDVTYVDAKYNGKALTDANGNSIEGIVRYPSDSTAAQQETYMVEFRPLIENADLYNSDKVKITLRYRAAGTLVNEEDPTDVISYPENNPLIYTETLSDKKLEQSILACPRQLGYDVLIDLTEAVVNDNRATTKVTVRKVWNDENNRFGIRPDSIDVILERSLDGVNWTSDFEGNTVTLTGDSKEMIWTAKPDVTSDVYDQATGKYTQYKYRIKEEILVPKTNNAATGVEYVPEYSTTTITNDDGTSMIDIVVENKIVTIDTEVAGRKTWNGTPAPSAYVALFQDDKFYDMVDVNAAANWKYAFDNLPKSDGEHSYDHVYLVRELDGKLVVLEDGDTFMIGDVEYKVTYDGNNINNAVTHRVVTNYIDRENNTLHESMVPYDNEPEGNAYDVRNTGSEGIDYRYPLLTKGDDIYYFCEIQDDSDKEGGTLDKDKEITYIYEKLENPEIHKERDKAVICVDNQDGTFDILYTLTVSNPNKKAIKNVNVSDVIPEGLAFVSSPDGTCENGVMHFVIPSIAAQGSEDVTFVARLSDKDVAKEQILGSKAPYYNTAYITSMDIDPTETGDIKTIDFTDNGKSDGIPSNEVVTYVYNTPPEIEKTADRDIVSLGDDVVYTITVKNKANTILYDVKVNDTLPAGLEAKGAEIKLSGVPADFTGADASVSVSGFDVNATIPCFGVGETAVITINVTVTESFKVYDNVAKITDAALEVNGPNIIDPPIEDNYVISKTADPFIEKTVDKAVARKGDKLTYTLTVKNPANHVLYDAKVTDTLPNGVELIDGTVKINGKTAKWNDGQFTIPSIDKDGGVAVITFDVKITTDDTATLINNCVLKEGILDVHDNGKEDDKPTPYNMPDDARTDLLIDPTIKKAVDKAIAGQDELVVYTLTVSNDDKNFDIHDVVVTDKIPAGLKFVSADNNGYEQNGTVYWTVPEIVKGGTATLKFTVSVQDRSEAIWLNKAYIRECVPDVNNDGVKDNEYRREYGDTNVSNIVETDTKYVLVIEYHADTPDGPVLKNEFHDGGNNGTPYDVNDEIPNIIVDENGDAWVKTYITDESDPLDGIYDSDKKMVVVYKKYDTAYTLIKKVSTDCVNWQDEITVKPGTKVYFKIVVSNTTKYDITGLKLSDAYALGNKAYSMPASWETIIKAFDGNLKANGKWESAPMSFDVPVDSYAGSRFINTATVSDDDDETDDIYDNAIVNVVADPGLSITKTANAPADENGRKVVPEGQRTAFTIVVTNTGNCDLENVNVVDDTYDIILIDENGVETPYAKGTAFDVIPKLEKGASQRYTVWFDVPASASDGEEFHNYASTSALRPDGEGTLTDTDDDSIFVVLMAPQLSIVKTEDKNEAEPGETVTYTVTVINTGRTDAENVYVADYMLDNGNEIDTKVKTWAIEEGFVIDKVPAHGSYVIESDKFTWQMPNGVPAGTIITNVAELYESKDAYDKGNDPIDDDKVDVVGKAVYDIEITKAANVSTVKPGGNSGYVIYVTNDSNAQLDNIVVKDSLNGNWGVLPEKTNGGKDVIITKNADDSLLINTLVAGDSVRFEYDYDVPESAVPGSDITNTATVTADDPRDPGNPEAALTDDDDAIVRVVDGELVITKTAARHEACPGDKVDFTLVVTNTGTEKVTNVKVTDDHVVKVLSPSDASAVVSLTDVSGTDATFVAQFDELAPGESKTMVVEYTIPQDAQPGKITNTAKAVDDDKHVAVDSDDVTVNPLPAPPVAPVYDLEIVKSANVSIATAGEEVVYTISVTNTGNAVLHNVVVTDTLDVNYGGTAYKAGTPIKTIPTLAVGATEIITVTRIVPADAAGTIVNTACADSDETDEVTDDANVMVAQPSVEMKKTVNSRDAVAGEKVYYTITVTNTGNVDLTDLEVVDSTIGYRKIIPSLAQGESWTSPADELYYIFDGSEIAGTEFKNTATVSNGVVLGASASCISEKQSEASTMVRSNGDFYSPSTGDSATEQSRNTLAWITAASLTVILVSSVCFFVAKKGKEEE